MEQNRNEAGGGSGRPPLTLLSDAVNRVSEAILFCMIMIMIVVTTLQVICRMFFDALIWSEELTTYLLVASSLLGAAVGFKRGSHIAVTFLVNKLPERGRKVMSIFVQLVGVVFFAVVAFYGAVLMKSEALQTTPALGISMTWIYIMYPVIGSVILLHLLAGFSGILGRR
jgi:TRAP-type C4-dicarboxylate transport system permease small subunit